MARPVITLDRISKKYRIGHRKEAYRTLRDTLADAAKAPLRRIRNFGQASHRAEDEIWAVRDVSFQVNQGEVLGVIGRNGSGKSTLLKILSRITEPTTGRAEIRGRVGSLLEVGTGFHPELTGRENVYLSGNILGMRRGQIDRRFDEIVAFSGVEQFIDTPVKRYSSGMAVRLGFAVAAHLEPEILLIDEVLAVGDVEFQKKCIGRMHDVASAGRTVLFVSHTMSAIQRLCPRTILLDTGEVRRDGETRGIVAEYLRGEATQGGMSVASDWRSAPGDAVARLRAVRSFDSDMKAGTTFGVRDPWCLDVEFYVLQGNHEVNVNAYFYDMADNLLFMTGDFQSDTWRGRTRPNGIHRSRCMVPANLLNEGTVRILVGLVTPPSTLRVVEPSALFVTLVDDGAPSGARGHYAANWPSTAVRPLFHWEHAHSSDLTTPRLVSVGKE